MIIFDILNWFAFVWFLFSWVGYTLYAKKKASEVECLAQVLHNYRVDWVRNMLRHEQRMSDMALLRNLGITVNFFASTTILVLVGSITALSAADNILELLSDFTFVTEMTTMEVEFKLILLILIFIFAFFRFTWSMRQYSFCSIILGAAPFIDNRPLSKEEEDFALYAAKVSDLAAHEFNYGLRSYYFALAVLSWFISPILFIVSCTIVVLILYRREFKSRTLDLLLNSHKKFTTITRQ